MTASIVASAHYLALALGFSGVVVRHMALKNCLKSRSLKDVYLGDNLWGVASLLWILTGLYRMLGGLEKGSSYYLHSSWFHLKIGLFLLIFCLELYPMITLIRWRIQGKINLIEQDFPKLRKFMVLNKIEIALVVVIVFVASKMARGF